MKIGLVSFECKNKDIDFNLSQIHKAMSEMQEKVDVLCFGETFLQGFVSLSWDYEIDKHIAISQESSVIKTLCNWTEEFNVGLITGYIEIDKDIIYSSCIVINEGKIIYNYRRISKGWKEFYKADYHYQEGDSVKEFELKGKKFMIALCGDLWDYPERFKTNNILIWPVYVNFSLDKWESIKFDYAKQANKAAAKTLLVNSIDKNPKSLGGAFYFENGKISLSNGFNNEKILIVDIPTDKMIYDITQPLFECEVFPGDSKPEKQILQRIDNGDVCNLTGFSMCAHNGTHVDAPYHFINEGKPINQVSLEKFIGPAFVIEHNGEVLEKDAYEMLEKAKKAYKGSEKKILIKGKATVSLEAAKVFAQKVIDLVGNESQTVGPENAPKEVHLVLLGAEVVLLEGIRLAHVPDGVTY